MQKCRFLLVVSFPKKAFVFPNNRISGARICCQGWFKKISWKRKTKQQKKITGRCFPFKSKVTCKNWAHLEAKQKTGLKSHLCGFSTQPFNYCMIWCFSDLKGKYRYMWVIVPAILIYNSLDLFQVARFSFVLMELFEQIAYKRVRLHGIRQLNSNFSNHWGMTHLRASHCRMLKTWFLWPQWIVIQSWLKSTFQFICSLMLQFGK